MTLSLPPDKATQLRELIVSHIPSLSPEDEDRIGDLIEQGEEADLALRTCACGVRVDGFYAYVDHLLDELDLDGASGSAPHTGEDGEVTWA